MELNKENLRLLPLVAVGLGKAALEVFVAPFIHDKADQVKHAAQASITYYRTPEK